MKQKTAIMMITWNRSNMTPRCVSQYIENAGLDSSRFDLYFCDQGSTDNVVELVEAIHPIKYYRKNKGNEGITRSFNQLLTRAYKDPEITHFVTVGNDILMPKNWLERLVFYHTSIPKSGLTGIQCVTADQDMPPIQKLYEYDVHYCKMLVEVFDKNGNKILDDAGVPVLKERQRNIFGTMFFSREVVDKVGGFCEELHPYGFGDSDLNNRIYRHFHNYYIPGMRTPHIGHDVDEQSEYRKMKWDSLKKSGNGAIYRARVDSVIKGEDIFEQLPEERAPYEP